MTPIRRIGVIGAGAWGSALAQAAARAGREVVLWARDASAARAIAKAGENPARLPGIRLDPSIRATGDLAEATSADALLLAVPAQALRAAVRRLPRSEAPLVICAKGFEQSTGAFLSAVVAEERPGAPVAVLSGPSFAAEVARGLPTAVTLAAADGALGDALVQALGSRTFRPYGTDDVAGVEVGGAVKNVLAIAAGVVLGRALGENARAAIVTRGLAELVRLGAALGARRETLMGLSGLGDLILTCGSLESRNTALGAALGRGAGVAEALASSRGVAEGVHTARAVMRLARAASVAMPIAAAVEAVLHDGADIDATVVALLERPFKAED